MEPNKPDSPEENPLKPWLEKWKDFKLAPPQHDCLKAVCWLAGFGAFLHPVFAYLPVKWPLFVMDGFLLAIVLLVLWRKRRVGKD